MAINLNDPDETRSFLVPAYEFEKGSEARQFDLDPQTCVGPANGTNDVYRLIHRDGLYVFPRGTRDFLFNTKAFFNRSIGQTDRPFFVWLQARPEEKPERVRSRCLMVEGRRLAPLSEDGRIELVPTYAAWRIPKVDASRGKEPWISRITSMPADDRVVTKSISVHWNGQGVLYAIAPDHTRHLLLVEFRIFDDDPEQPDLLKIWATRHALSEKGVPQSAPAGGRIDQDWSALIARAARGYLDECAPQCP